MSLKNALETAKEILEMESMTMGVEAEMDKKSVKKKKALRDAPASKSIDDADTIAKLKASWDTTTLGNNPYL